MEGGGASAFAKAMADLRGGPAREEERQAGRLRSRGGAEAGGGGAPPYEGGSGRPAWGQAPFFLNCGKTAPVPEGGGARGELGAGCYRAPARLMACSP